MFAQEITLFHFMNGYLQKVLTGFSDEALTQPVPGAVNPPAYILGHLAISNDFALSLLKQPTVCPKSWAVAFGPGSSPDKMKIEFPSRIALLEALQTGYERIVAAAPDADPEAMAQPHSVAVFQGTPIQTVGDCVALLMTTHFSLHIGQLSLMRRQRGHAPLF